MAFYSPLASPFYTQSPYTSSPYSSLYEDHTYQQRLARRERELVRQQQLKREAYEEELARRRYAEQLRRQQEEREYFAALKRRHQLEERSRRAPGSPFAFFDELFTQAPSSVDRQTTLSPPPSLQPIRTQDDIEAPAGDNPAPAPVATPEVASSSPSPANLESAACTLQRHYRAHCRRREALTALNSLSTELAAARSDLTLPDTLVYQEGDRPILAFSSTNAPFLAYEDRLVKLLSRIDEIQSGGDAVIKRARKNLVKKVEQELEKLDTFKMASWQKSNSSGGGENFR